jgi:thymidylate synthase (FAD)
MTTIEVLNLGFVRLVDHMPRENLDSSIVQAARVSYGDGTKTTHDDAGLIRYLMRHWHSTPFEMVEFKFHIKMPIYIARQHMRHRTASINERSARYTVVKDDDYYIPGDFRGQSRVNHQGSNEDLIEIGSMKTEVVDQLEGDKKIYDKLLNEGVCREQARGNLPQSQFTEFYWKINLHNLMHYLQLRMDSHAQKEIQEYANAMFSLIEPLVPVAMQAFMDFRVNAISLTGPELDNLKNGTVIKSPGERREFEEKKLRFQ